MIIDTKQVVADLSIRELETIETNHRIASARSHLEREPEAAEDYKMHLVCDGLYERLSDRNL